jgi:hypothetical protein
MLKYIIWLERSQDKTPFQSIEARVIEEIEGKGIEFRDKEDKGKGSRRKAMCGASNRARIISDPIGVMSLPAAFGHVFRKCFGRNSR